MQGMNDLQAAQKKGFIAAIILMMLIAFIQGFITTHDLYWAADPDFDRDIAFAQGALEGHFGKDPSYAGEYLWYNPLLFSMEAFIAKVSGLPINLVVTRAGAYLNLLGPISFVVMVSILFNIRIALASLLSYLFFATGNILGWGAATYSPWLYPVCFMQFVFYLNILLTYKAFKEQDIVGFLLLGLGIGLSFLGHTAPTVLIILLLIYIQGDNIRKAFKEKDYASVRKYFMQGGVTFISFVVAAFPILYYVFGKYRLQLINRATFEYSEGIFIWNNVVGMIKSNVSISFFIAIYGFIWFYRNFQNALIRKIILGWFFISIGMYVYSTIVAGLDSKFKIHLPGTVPSFHYFFYLKALQSVFFGFGFLQITRPLIAWISGLIKSKKPNANLVQYSSALFIGLVLICAILYFPFYKNRQDFVALRENALIKAADKGKLDVYHFIVKNISNDKVILCDKDPSLFPVMPTGRKMVSTAYTFSNPYLSFDKRESDRLKMLSYLQTGAPQEAASLFEQYHVNYVLVSNDELNKYVNISALSGQPVYKNSEYTIFEITQLNKMTTY